MIKTYREMFNVRSQGELRGRITQTVELRNSVMPEPLVAYINHGRWVADCTCGSGIGVAPDEDEFVCVECGTVHAVFMPPNAPELEDVLEVRPLGLRNWVPEQSRADLIAENLVNNLPATASEAVAVTLPGSPRRRK